MLPELRFVSCVCVLVFVCVCVCACTQCQIALTKLVSATSYVTQRYDVCVQVPDAS
jgi:hypothetical protein